MRNVAFVTLPTAAIAPGAATPIPPGGMAAAVWSTVANAMLVFDGATWEAQAASQGGGIDATGYIDSITYDTAGNITDWTGPGVTGSVAVDAGSGRTISITENGATRVLNYDSATGRLTSITNLASASDSMTISSIVYNGAGQVTSMSGPSYAATLAYDALGRPSSITENGTTRTLNYDALTGLLSSIT